MGKIEDFVLHRSLGEGYLTGREAYGMTPVLFEDLSPEEQAFLDKDAWYAGFNAGTKAAEIFERGSEDAFFSDPEMPVPAPSELSDIDLEVYQSGWSRGVLEREAMKSQDPEMYEKITRNKNCQKENQKEAIMPRISTFNLESLQSNPSAPKPWESLDPDLNGWLGLTDAEWEENYLSFGSERDTCPGALQIVATCSEVRDNDGSIHIEEMEFWIEPVQVRALRDYLSYWLDQQEGRTEDDE